MVVDVWPVWWGGEVCVMTDNLPVSLGMYETLDRIEYDQGAGYSSAF